MGGGGGGRAGRSGIIKIDFQISSTNSWVDREMPIT